MKERERWGGRDREREVKLLISINVAGRDKDSQKTQTLPTPNLIFKQPQHGEQNQQNKLSKNPCKAHSVKVSIQLNLF